MTTLTITFKGSDESKSALQSVTVGLDDVGKAADQASEKGGGFFSNMLSTATGFLAANVFGAITSQATAFIGSAFADARGAEALMASTQQTIDSMGNAAGVSAEHVAEMASALSDASGMSLFGDDQIQQSQNLLLTFGEIKGETFDLATALTVDLATALGGAPKDQAMMLGKALNDPINGISALGKAGLTFSEEQKALIASLQESGDMAGAQAIIIAELNKQVGGQAEAAAKADGGWAELQGRLGEMGEGIAAQLLPVINDLVGVLLDDVMPVVEDIAGQAIPALTDAWNTIAPIVQPVIQTITDLLTGQLGPSVDEAATTFSRVQATITAEMEAIGAVVGAVIEQVMVFWQANGDEILAFVDTTWKQINDIIQVAMDLINATVVPALQALASFISAHSDDIQHILSSAWDVISGIITTALNLIEGIINTVLLAIEGDWSGAWESLQSMSADFVSGILSIVTSFLDMIAGFFGTSLDEIANLWSSNWTKLGSLASSAIDGLVELIMGLPAQVTGVGEAVVDMIWSGLEAQWGELEAWFTDQLQQLRDQLPFSEPRDSSSPLYGLGKAGESIISQITGGMKSAGGQLPKMMDALATDTTNALGNLVSQVEDFFGDSDAPGEASDLGENILNSLAEGMADNIAEAVKVAKRAADSIVSQVEESFEISSPSRVMGAIGNNVMLGLLGGLDEMAPALLDTINQIMSSMQVTMAQALEEGNDAWADSLKAQLETLAEVVDGFAERVSDALASSFEAVGGMARQQERNLAALDKFEGPQREAVQRELDAALAEANAIDDPAQAAEVYAARSKAILDAARLRKEADEAGADERLKIEEDHQQAVADLEKENQELIDQLGQATTDAERARLQELISANDRKRNEERAAYLQALEENEELARVERERIDARMRLLQQAHEAEMAALAERREAGGDLQALAEEIQAIFDNIERDGDDGPNALLDALGALLARLNAAITAPAAGSPAPENNAVGGARIAGPQPLQQVFHIDARGAQMSAAEFERIARRVADEAAEQAYNRRRMR